MKKFVMGLIIGAVLMVSSQAFGAGISFVGKKVDGQTPVTINGENIGDAIVIQGKSFVPVREITQGFGGTVEQATGKGIALKMSDISAITPTVGDSSNNSELLQQIEQQKKLIKSINAEISGLEGQLPAMKEKSDADDTTVGIERTKYEIFKNTLQQRKDKLLSEESKLSDLESQLTELQK